MTTSRILVTGSRDWADYGAIRDALNEALHALAPGTPVLVHGDCESGADAIARQIWVEHWRRPEEPHPADWARHRKRAGYLRNEAMVGLGADVCLAFIGPCRKPDCKKPQPHGSHGATMTAALAEHACIPTKVFRA